MSIYMDLIIIFSKSFFDLHSPYFILWKYLLTLYCLVDSVFLFQNVIILKEEMCFIYLCKPAPNSAATQINDLTNEQMNEAR